MIHAVSVLKAYTALRGTYVYHLPMAIAMLIFIRIPDNDTFPGALYWYITSVFLHFLLTFIHLTEFFQVSDKSNHYVLEIGKIFTIPLQAFNFILLATLYVESPSYTDLDEEGARFKIWLFIEAVMVVSQVLTNMLFVLIRTMERTKVSVMFGSNDDELSDYVSTVEI